eukprot:94196_1
MGYPSDEFTWGPLLWRMGGKCTMNRIHTKYHYKIETYSGYSGAAIFSIDEKKDTDNKEDKKNHSDVATNTENKENHPVVKIYGIHVAGDQNEQHNIGIKLNTKKIEWINNCLSVVEQIINVTLSCGFEYGSAEIKNQLEKLEIKSWWSCEQCEFINQRLMVG